MKLDRTHELVAFSRALGETLLMKRLVQSDLSQVDQLLKQTSQTNLMFRDWQVDRKALIVKQKHLGREISRLRKSVEISRRKLLVG